MKTYVVTLERGAEPVRFPVVALDDVPMDDLQDLEVRLDTPFPAWPFFGQMRALLWHAARVAGKLPDLLPPGDRPDDSVPGLLEGLTWDVVGRLAKWQVLIEDPDATEPPEGDDADPPAEARG